MIKNANVASNAELDSLKLDFAFATNPTTMADGSTTLATAHEGKIGYNTTDDALVIWTGSAWSTFATAAALTGDLDDALQLDPKGLRPMEIEYSHATNKCLVLDQNGNGGCLTLENAGTGTDITGTAFNITVGGVLTATGLTMVDAKVITLGTGSDFTIQCDSSNHLQFDGAAADTVIKIGASNNQDLQIHAGTATDYVLFDTDDSAKQIICEDFHLLMMDDTDIRIGDSADVVIDWDTSGTDYLLINPAADDTLISFGVSAATQLSCDVRIYGNAANGAEYIYFDASESELYFVGCDLWLKDDDILEFGNSSDITMTWAAGGGITVAAAADNSVFTVGNGTESLNLKWFGGDANHYVLFDCDGGTYGIWDFGKDANGVNVRFYGDTSGAYLYWDETNDMLVGIGGAQVSLNDDVELLLGTGTSSAGDFKIYGSGTGPVLVIDAVTAETGSVAIGADNLGIDLKIYSATASAFWLFDASADQLISGAGSSLNLIDDTEIRFGTGASGGAGDLKLSSNSSNVLQLEQVASTVGTFEIGVDGVGIDTKFHAEAASSYLLWDQNYNTNGGLVFEGVDAVFNDDDVLFFGDDRDFQVFYDSTNTRLEIDAGAANGEIRIGSNTDTDLLLEGTTATDTLTWDASDDALEFSDGTATYSISLGSSNELLIVPDSDDRVIEFGTSAIRADIQFWCGDADAAAFIYLDASDDSANGVWEFGQDDHGIDVVFFGAATGEYVKWDQSADALIHGDGTAAFSWTLESNALRLTPDADDRMVEFGSATIRTDVKFHGGDADAAAFVWLDASGDSSNGSWYFGADDHGVDVVLYGATANFNITFDQSANELVCAGGAYPTYIRLPASTLAQVDAVSATGTAGQIAFISNGAGGNATLAFSDGSNWLRADTLAACASS